MKVVLFCGGLGTRLREYSDKSLSQWFQLATALFLAYHEYYAHYGHKEFILCLGYKADMFKNYFMDYDEYLSNNFVYENGGSDIRLLNTDIHDWKITFVDTGMHTNIGGRLRAVQPFLEGEEVFLANYTDILTDLHLPTMIDHFHKSGKSASFLATPPRSSFHVVHFDDQYSVKEISTVTKTEFWINGGFFILKKEIFDYMEPGEELVEEPFQRLIADDKLSAYKYKGFWAPMDTFKEKMLLDDLYASGNTPWQVWENEPEAQSTISTLQNGQLV